MTRVDIDAMDDGSVSSWNAAADSWTVPTPSTRACVTVGMLAVCATCATNFGLGSALHDGRGWRAWQPFARGRRRFVALQAVGWTCASCALACGIGAVANVVGAEDGGKVTAVLSVGALVLGVFGEICVAFSLAFFASKDDDDDDANSSSSSSSKSKSKSRRSLRNLDARNALRVVQLLAVLNVLHAPQALIFAVLATGWFLGRFALVALVAFYALSYNVFAQKELEQGRRKWDAFQSWAADVVESAAKSWYGDVRLVFANGSEEQPANDDAPLIFGYHPHSLIPAGAVWFWMLPAFAEKYRNVKPVTLAASALFKAPFVREMAAWLGVRSVSREVFQSSLRADGAVVVCPGGQGEMCEHVGGLSEDVITLCTKHKGFVRMAIEERAKLVPVVVFGESSSWRNVLRHPGRYFYSRFRLAMPLFAVGYLGFLPIPARVPLTFVIGAPMSVPEPDARGEARESDVSKTHRAYYDEIARLFHEHREESGFANLRLEIKD